MINSDGVGGIFILRHRLDQGHHLRLSRLELRQSSHALSLQSPRGEIVRVEVVRVAFRAEGAAEDADEAVQQDDGSEQHVHHQQGY